MGDTPKPPVPTPSRDTPYLEELIKRPSFGEVYPSDAGRERVFRIASNQSRIPEAAQIMDIDKIRSQIPTCQRMSYLKTGWSGPSPVR